jgi:catechol 2,3-dioxygenase-like lactoylglutathione lyase family enzyme
MMLRHELIKLEAQTESHPSEAFVDARNSCTTCDVVAWILAVFCLTAVLAAQTPLKPDSPPMNGIAHVAIRVQDLLASRAFYEKLGYQEAFALENGGTATEAFLKVNDTQFIELYPKHKPEEVIGFMHVCFASGNLEELNKYYTSHRLEPTPVKRAGAGNLLFTMLGPEDQNIEFTQYMLGSKHTLDIGRHLGADRISDQIYGVGIQMQNRVKAVEFYSSQMGFSRTIEQNKTESFRIPGYSDQVIKILPKSTDNRLQLILAVKDLKQTADQLRQRGMRFEKRKSALMVQDPDGNGIELMLASMAGDGAE